jgi:hypothetical protein
MMWACSFGLSATSQQYFSLRTNQPPAIIQQYFSLRTNQHQPSAKRTGQCSLSAPEVAWRLAACSFGWWLVANADLF